ncbi:LOW QUALITY PROTEIN: hepatic lectin-like [Portunus trituberculatus]|uniref:LOW QUALITY PROTEIN: hepatic lectin-like n=1 Tax=Portunus trituberculatus TaxID=210409 RepID=UPI001E1CDE79|nr:LOW QUALITY PROTEIN: hepatic lectin-like [Portunus trituberculatus]
MWLRRTLFLCSSCSDHHQHQRQPHHHYSSTDERGTRYQCCHAAQQNTSTMTGFRLLSFLGTLAVVAATHVKPGTQVECGNIFTEMGGRCVRIELITIGTWIGLQNFCELIGGNLVNLSDVQFYSDLVMYLENLNVKKSFWIGARDVNVVEGLWMWMDGSATRMGTPFWANYGENNDQTPDGGTAQNCAFLDAEMHYYFNDASCEDSFFHAICEKQKTEFP